MYQLLDVESWIIDDTGWLKKGNHSVGVQRQYTGTSGKVDNCQLGVSLVAATEHSQVPLDFDLYLPESWAEDMERRRQAKIPDEVEFQSKLDIAMAMIDRAIEDELPVPRISRKPPIITSAMVKPIPVPMASSKERKTLCLAENASWRPRIMQLTTIRAINAPNSLC